MIGPNLFQTGWYCLASGKDTCLGSCGLRALLYVPILLDRIRVETIEIQKAYSTINELRVSNRQ